MEVIRDQTEKDFDENMLDLTELRVAIKQITQKPSYEMTQNLPIAVSAIESIICSQQISSEKQLNEYFSEIMSEIKKNLLSDPVLQMNQYLFKREENFLIKSIYDSVVQNLIKSTSFVVSDSSESFFEVDEDTQERNPKLNENIFSFKEMLNRFARKYSSLLRIPIINFTIFFSTPNFQSIISEIKTNDDLLLLCNLIHKTIDEVFPMNEETPNISAYKLEIDGLLFKAVSKELLVKKETVIKKNKIQDTRLKTSQAASVIGL